MELGRGAAGPYIRNRAKGKRRSCQKVSSAQLDEGHSRELELELSKEEQEEGEKTLSACVSVVVSYDSTNDKIDIPFLAKWVLYIISKASQNCVLWGE